MAAAIVILVLLIAASGPSAYAVEHIVGGSNGWTTSVDYATWAAGEKFVVGDTLVFNYDSGHDVEVMTTEYYYNNCFTRDDGLRSYDAGQTTVTLTQPGPMYFACPAFGHCSLGMKLAINVKAHKSTNWFSGASGRLGSMNQLIVGYSFVLVAVIAYIF